MEELQQLANIINSLPQLAIYIFLAFFCYKIVVIGSVFSLIKLTVNKVYDYYVTRTVEYTVDTDTDIMLTSKSTRDSLVGLLKEVSNSKTISYFDVEKLITAWNSYKKQQGN